MPADAHRNEDPAVVAAAFAVEMAQLQSPRGRAVPWRMRRFLPNPLASLDQLERMRCADIPSLRAHQCLRELAQLSLAVASMDDEVDVPRWIWRRRDALVRRLRRGEFAA